MFETHPYLRRDEGDRRIAAMKTNLPNNPYYSEVLARKHLVGQITKRDARQTWYEKGGFDWQPDRDNIESWGVKFEKFLEETKNQELAQKYNPESHSLEAARSLRELGNVYQGFIGYIYADGNNIGGYIQKIKTPQEYKQFSEDIFAATEKSVYFALAKHLKPHQLKNLTDPDNKHRNDSWIHPFEILAIGGDDVMLIVPANKALEIAKTIGEKFEEILAETGRYQPDKSSYESEKVHRYSLEAPTQNKSSLSMSIGVLITAKDTPVYYAEDLTSQLLKSAKKRAKKLKSKDKEKGYLGGTIDFLSMKSVTMQYYKVSPVGETVKANTISKPLIPERKKKIEDFQKTHQFKVGDILDAKVIKKSRGKKVTYEIEGISYTEKEQKKFDIIPENQIVKVEIKSLKEDGSINHIKFYKK